jgi:predicted nucleotidyltransferase
MPNYVENLDFAKANEDLKSEKRETAESVATEVFMGEEGEKRRQLKSNLMCAFEKITDANMDFEEAEEKGLIKSEELAKIYDGLTDFIKEDLNNDRIILYLPFQLLPSMDRKSSDEGLEKSKENFRKIYKESWIRLLFETDSRADFIDGDVLESGMGNPVSVRKAAHLLPEILEKKIISSEEIKNLMEIIDDETLKINLTEGLIVAAERKLIDFDFDKKLIEKLLELQKPKIDFDFIVSRKRSIWENRMKREAQIDEESEMVKEELIKGVNNLDELTSICQVVGVFKAGKEVCLTEKYLPIIYKCWQEKDDGFKKYIKSGLSHWKKMGIIDDETLKKFGIKLPNFDKITPVEIDELMENDFRIFGEVVEEIKKDEELMKYVYPTILVFGSRVKGYAEMDADLDAAIFFRPETPFEKREEILERLYEKQPKLNLVEKILEYWIEEKEGKFGFKNIDKNNGKIIGAKEIHIFWGGIWIGENNEFRKIREDIKNKYLNLDRFGKQKEQLRMSFLRQLETDTIQCRLMHKGWRYFYPSKKIERNEDSDLIDGKSDFWEPEFRRLATQLFLTKVFLPEIG